ncbi:MAG TPA: helix-turn-helix domain-containing protein [Propionibacteriaceae bacterium]|jgi:excisionase family DNA binding protein
MIEQGDLTIAEVAAMTKLSPKTIRRYAKNGIVPSYRVGLKEMFRFKPADVERLITAR